MKRKLILALVAISIPALARERGDDQLRRDMEFAKQQVYPALVNISVVVKMFGGGRVQRAPAAGSGVIVSPAGHVVTNYHVAGDSTRIVCHLPSKESIPADVIAHDPLTDLTILQLRLSARKNGSKPLPFARIGNSDELEVGDYVLAMGNPMGLSSSMTLGIVSNTKRVFTSFTGAEMEDMDLGGGQRTGLFTRWVQHDALILPGNSGGPLVNLSGEVVGINELGGTGVGFAIPSTLVSHVLNQALTHGSIPRGWVGASFYPVGKMGLEHGVLIASIQNGGPAFKAGLRAGDILLSISGHATDATHFEDIPLVYRFCSDCPAGHDALVRYRRAGEVHETNLRFEQMESYLADQHNVEPLGVTVRDITGPMALVRRYPDTDGVLLTGIRPGRPFDTAKPSIHPGDIVLEIDGQAIKDVKALVELAAGLKRREAIPIRLRRADESIVTVFSTKKPREGNDGGELPKAWIGIRTQVLTPSVAKALGLEKTRGFRITQVYEDTEAARAGLRVGDLITAIDGKALDAFRVQDGAILRRRVESLLIDEKAKLSLVRDSAPMEIEVVLQESPQTAAQADSTEDTFLEVKVRDITFPDRIKNRWTGSQQGVMVTQVIRGGWAFLAGLRAGDLIERLDRHEVTDVASFKKTIRTIRKERPETVRIFVRRDYRTVFVFVQPEY